MQGRADKGIIMTTGIFTSEARKEAARDGVPPIELVGVAPLPWTVNICGITGPLRDGLSALPAPDLGLMPTRDRGSAGLLRSRFPALQPEAPVRASFRS